MSNHLFDLSGKVALATGSSRGLGFAMARGLGRAGATLILNGRNKVRLGNAVEQLNNEGFKAFGYDFDVVKSDEIRKSIKRIENEAGPIEILVNNAGIQKRAPIVDMKESDWREVLDINLTGVFLTTQQVVKGMIERKRGKIINICSLLSEVSRPTLSPYIASKGGLKMLTRAMAVEWARYNIQVNGIGPGYFSTEMNCSLINDKKFNDWVCERTPVGRWGLPEELEGAAVFLSSEASNFMTGQIIYIDGGFLASV